MKIILTTLILLTFISADLIPPNSKSISKTVILTNAPDFKNVSIFLCSKVITNNGELECKVLNKYNEEISKGYKFNIGPYLFAIKNSTIKKLGGIDKFIQDPIKKALTYLIEKKSLNSNIGSSYTKYINSNSKETDTTTKYKIVSIKNNTLELIKLDR